MQLVGTSKSNKMLKKLLNLRPENQEDAAIDEWRCRELRRPGKSSANPNFIPLPEAAAATGPATAEGPPSGRGGAAGAADAAAADVVPDLVAASENLPPGWAAVWDPGARRVYYANYATGQSLWEPP